MRNHRFRGYLAMRQPGELFRKADRDARAVIY